MVAVQYEELLRARTTQLGPRHVHFVGWVDDPLPWVDACNVLVLPSLGHGELVLGGEAVTVRGGEAFPAAVLEAMALARPVVATRNAGIPEQVEDGVTGILIDQRPDDQLGDALARLLRDHSLREALGAAGAARVEARFTRTKTVDALVHLYRRLGS